ncbi:MAG TPA: hypothetical protein VM432_01750 [Bdellovibrionales bacterium]|nr:hypothetical protein [Bdellovibrionales bacterium]
MKSKSFVRTAAAFAALTLIACQTSPKAPKTEYLVGETDISVESKEIQDSLAREVVIKQKAPLTEQEKREFINKRDYKESRTTTQVRIYPYTKPLLTARVREAAKDRAFKEKLSVAQVQSDAQKEIAQLTKHLVDDKPCFAFELWTDQAEAVELKYYSGELTQDGKKQVFTFTKGIQKTVVDQMPIYGGTITKLWYSSHSNVCGSSKIDLLKPFALEIEPRFKRDLLPVKAEWLPPRSM